MLRREGGELQVDLSAGRRGQCAGGQAAAFVVLQGGQRVWCGRQCFRLRLLCLRGQHRLWLRRRRGRYRRGLGLLEIIIAYVLVGIGLDDRSEGRRVGKEWVWQWRYRGGAI